MTEENNMSGHGEVRDQPHVPDDHAKSLDFKERLDHFASGYSQSQAVVRFLDTKATAVIGGQPVIRLERVLPSTPIFEKPK